MCLLCVCPSVNTQDEDSQAILSLLQCTNSRLGFSGSAGGVPGGGDGAAGAAAAAGDSGAGGSSSASNGGRRRARDEYSGELDAQEVANGFGMGMSSKVCMYKVLVVLRLRLLTAVLFFCPCFCDKGPD